MGMVAMTEPRMRRRGLHVGFTATGRIHSQEAPREGQGPANPDCTPNPNPSDSVTLEVPGCCYDPRRARVQPWCTQKGQGAVMTPSQDQNGV